MGKGNKGNAAVAVAVAPKAAVVAKPAKVGMLAVKAGLTYRGARAAWYAVLVQHNGKPAKDYLEACTTKPPSVPKSGRVEAPSGWLSYFVRTGAVTLTTAE